MTDPTLREFLDDGYRENFGMTVREAHEQGVCASCRKPPTFISDAGRREYRISAMCEPCWMDLIPVDEEEE